MGGTMGKIIKDTIHANGIDIGIYTQDFENEFLSLTDIARYKSDEPTAVIQNWMRNRDVIELDRSHECYWYCFKSRTLWRDICS